MRQASQASTHSPGRRNSTVSNTDYSGFSEGLRILARIVARRLVQDRRYGTEGAEDHKIREEGDEAKRAEAGHQPDMNVKDGAL